MPAFNAPKTKLQLHSIGEVCLRAITLGATEVFFEIVAKGNSTDKEFVQEILFHLLLTPKMSKEDFKKISDDDLIMITKAFVETEKYTFKDYIDTGDIFSDFRRTITKSLEEEEKRLREAFAPLLKNSGNIAKSIKDIYAPNPNLTALAAWQNLTSSETLRELNHTLTMLAQVDLEPFRTLLEENKKSVAGFSTYLKDYYALNEKIAMTLSSTFAAQTVYPQKDFTRVIQAASRLSVKNEMIFTQNIREINSFPVEQKSILYNKSEIKLFSIDEVELVLQKIKKGIEAHSQLMFWSARTKGKLAENPERIAQGLMMNLLYMILPNKLVFSFQLLSSGSGIIDILLTFSNEYGELQKVILELKVFEEGHNLNDGIEQTAQYMKDQETEYGYRVIFNATKKKLEEQSILAKNGKKLKNITININLPNPSSLDKKSRRA